MSTHSSPASAGPTAGAGLSEALTEVERQFALMFVRGRNAVRRRAEALEPGLPAICYRVLSVLARAEGCQQVHLADRLETDKAVISRAVSRLEELGLVHRRPDPGDRRAFLVEITPLGQQRFDEVNAAERRMLADRLAEWELDDVRRLADLLARLNEIV